MITTISKLVNIDLNIEKQEQGYLKCEPLQYICNDNKGNRYILFVAVNPIQEYTLKMDIEQQKECAELENISIFKTIYYGKFEDYFFSLYVLPFGIKKYVRKSPIHFMINEMENTLELRKNMQQSLLDGHPIEFQEEIKELDEYNLYIKSVTTLSKLYVGNLVQVNKNSLFWNKSNDQILCFAIDVKQNVLMPAQGIIQIEQYQDALKKREKLLKRIDELYERYYEAVVNEIKDISISVYPNVFFNWNLNNNHKSLNLRICEWKKDTELTVEIYERVAILHSFLMPISFKGLNAVVKYLFKTFDKKIQVIKYDNVIYRFDTGKLIQQAVIQLPSNIEDLAKRMSSKGRYNMRRERRIIAETIGEYWIETYNGDEMPEEYIHLYFEYKKASHNREYGMTAQQYIDNQHVTTLYVMKTIDKVLAVLLSCEDNENVYFENFSYCPEYKSLSIGSVMYYMYLEELIKKNKKVLFLGNGKYDYKKRYGSMYFNTYSGKIYRLEILNLFWRYYYCLKKQMKKNV